MAYKREKQRAEVNNLNLIPHRRLSSAGFSELDDTFNVTGFISGLYGWTCKVIITKNEAP
jgi:hypothetical protein